MGQPLRKIVWQFLTKLNLVLPFDPAIMPLGIYSGELTTKVHIETGTQIFMAALPIIAQNWE